MRHSGTTTATQQGAPTGELGTGYGMCATVLGQNAHKKPIQSQLNQLN